MMFLVQAKSDGTIRLYLVCAYIVPKTCQKYQNISNTIEFQRNSGAFETIC